MKNWGFWGYSFCSRHNAPEICISKRWLIVDWKAHMLEMGLCPVTFSLSPTGKGYKFVKIAHFWQKHENASLVGREQRCERRVLMCKCSVINRKGD